MSNYKLEFIEDDQGDLVDVLYWHGFERRDLADYPCPNWPDYDVYCEGCGELIHAGNS